MDLKERKIDITKIICFNYNEKSYYIIINIKPLWAKKLVLIITIFVFTIISKKE